MPTSYTIRTTQEPDDPRRALQKKARRQGFHALGVSNFAAYATPDYLGQVAIYDFEGNKVAGPFDLEAADAWLAQAQLDRLLGRAIGVAS